MYFSDFGNYGGEVSIVETFNDEGVSAGFSLTATVHAYGDVTGQTSIHAISRDKLKQFHNDLTELLAGLKSKV